MGIDIRQLSPEAQRQILDKLGGKKPRRSKYNAVRTWADGVCFDSKKEADYYRNAKLYCRSGQLAGVLYHGRFVLTAGDGPENRAVTYEPDFVLLYPDGRYKIIDVKGTETKEFKMKMKLLKEKHPGIEVILA